MTVVQALPAPPSLLGESPFWHPDEAALYWCDIAGQRLNRWHPATEAHRSWELASEPGCCAPLRGGRILLAMRDGLFRFDPQSGERERLCAPPYEPRQERFNDGKADPQGRLWVGTIYEPRTTPAAALYRWDGGQLARVAGDVTVSNGLAFSPDGATIYWADTSAHRVMAYHFDAAAGLLSAPRVLAQFEAKAPDQDLASYGGRPDGAAVDAEGAYWCAMYEGQQLLRIGPDGRVLRSLKLPVRCPTMPCFGGADLRTLFITSARHQRPAAELAAQPLAGCVLVTRVDVPGLPVNFAQD